MCWVHGARIPLKIGWESPGVAVFSSGLNCVVQCLNEKAVLCFFLYRELLIGQPQPRAQLLAGLCRQRFISLNIEINPGAEVLFLCQAVLSLRPLRNLLR